MLLNLKHKLSEQDSKNTVDIIKSHGFDKAFEFAYTKALQIIELDKTTNFAVELLAWSENLNIESISTLDIEKANDLKTISYFYKKLAHKMYHHLRKTDSIAHLPFFIQEV